MVTSQSAYILARLSLSHSCALIAGGLAIGFFFGLSNLKLDFAATTCSQNQYFGCGFLFPVVSPFRFVSFLVLPTPEYIVQGYPSEILPALQVLSKP